MTGRIVKLLDQNCGFILRGDGRRIFFSAGETHNFDALRAGDIVEFSDELFDLFGDGKMRALDVRKVF